jgi:hypothetical protein
MFKKLEPINNNPIKAILIVVGRVKEGSDVEYLDCGIYLDPVKNRSTVISMQTAGRVMRIDTNKLKEYACIIEGYLGDNTVSKQRLCVEQIITYYKKLLQISEDTSDYKNKLLHLLKNTHYDNKENYIRLKIDSNMNHDCILDVGCNIEDWSSVTKLVTDYVKSRVKDDDLKFLDGIENIKKIKKNKAFFTNSKITKVILNNTNKKITSWRGLVEGVYKYINDVDRIKIIYPNIISGNENMTKGFKYMKELNISFQNLNSIDSLLEFVKQCEFNDIKYDIDITKDNNILNFKSTVDILV